MRSLIKVFGFSLLLAVCAFGFAPDQTRAEDRMPFDQWLTELRTEALEAGIAAETLDAALAGVTFDEKVVASDRNQPEFRQTYQGYMNARVTDARIRIGREMLDKYRDELAAVEEAYGVQPRFIVAIWGVETNFGSFTGGQNVIQSLVTLAYDPRRATYFRRELLAALRILEDGHITADAMKGSWAGAMGQPQFMPTSFNAYAQDFDGDGRRDIWTTPEDVFASIAHYLKTYGWDGRWTWGRRVNVPDDLDQRVAEHNVGIPADRCALRDHVGDLDLAKWQDLGVRRDSGDDLPAVDLNASLVRPGGDDGPAFLTYGNYRSILRYNCSNFYALSVGHLADAFIFRSGDAVGSQ